MKENVGLLGVGACGGNQVFAFKKYDLPSFYINSSLEDLKSLGLDDIHYYHLEGATGCHKNRDVSKQYLADNFQAILDNIQRYLSGKYIFLFGSLGGGTFSGMSAFLTELIEAELGKVVIPVVTIPTTSESSQANINAYKALQELSECYQHTLFIVDNEKEQNFAKSNQILADSIYSLITDVSTSIDGIFDYSEIAAMLEYKGYGVLGTFTRKSSQVDVTPCIKKAIKENIFADVEETNGMYYCGLKFSVTKKTITFDPKEIQLQYGHWRDLFVGYQTKSDMVFMTGLSFPMSAINRLSDVVKENKDNIKRDMKNVVKKPIFDDDLSLDFDNDFDDIDEPEHEETLKEKLLREQKEKESKPSMRDKLLQMSKK